MPTIKILKYGMVIAIATYLQFSSKQIGLLCASLQYSLGRFQPSQNLDSSDDEGAKQIICGCTLTCVIIAMLYVLWLRSEQCHAEDLVVATISKRFVDFRFVYLMAQMNKQELLIAEKDNK